jgi:beta-mannosidase
MHRIEFIFLLILWLIAKSGSAQIERQNILENWTFSDATLKEPLKANVPGTVHTDLLGNKIIPDPYFGTNEHDLQWIGEKDWIYQTTFSPDKKLLNQKEVWLVLDGLDTYADVFLNGALILQADNMFRQWRIPVKEKLKNQNTLTIHFASAKKITDSLAKQMLPLVIPDNPRVYARKAQYHFGWDWGPTFITCGIWKPVYLEGYNVPPTEKPFTNPVKIELVQQADSVGKSFYFKIDGQAVYMKGANYIPSDMFLPRLTKADYRKILQSAKDANMNMLRVWGGGIYEDDAFYELCDEMGIYIWQDFMFACAMVPEDEKFFENVKQEVIYQIKRLRHYRSIVLWCGNNEVDEAWHNWGWQKQFNLHGDDSARVWQAYKRLFRDSIPAWVKQYDGTRPYVSTSPMHGWGRPQSYSEGDSHYWGIWWGLEDIEIFEHKTGRFVSEYGMQAMPNVTTVYGFTQPEDRYRFSPALKTHQKHPTGYENIQSYLHRYFMDSSKIKNLSLEDYIYLTQCMQYYALKNSIAIHRSKYPVNMGTLLWQLNDCWPVASWSITDYSRQPKAGWYAVKQAYREDVPPERDSIRPINIPLSNPVITIKKINDSMLHVTSDVLAKYVYLYVEDSFLNPEDNYFDLRPGEEKFISIKSDVKDWEQKVKVKTLWEVVALPG